MTYKNLCGWHPIPADCTRIEGGNLSGVVLPDREITFVGVNLVNCVLTDKHTVIDCATGNCQPLAVEPVVDIELASKAELVLQSLIASGKLSAEMITVLNGLMDGVKQSANVTDIETGLAATMQTTEIIERLRQQGNNELASQIEQALTAVQSIWRVE